jgi:cell wall-associated NlpC family hydrolase
MHRARPLAAILALACALVVPGPAGAEPSDLDAKRAEAAGIEAELERNGARISELAEQFNQSVIAIEEAEASMADAQDALDTARADQEALRVQVAARAAELYMSVGNAAGLIQLDASDVREAGATSTYVEAAQAQDEQLFNDLTVAGELLDERIAALEDARRAAEAQRDALERQRADLEAAAAEQEAILADLEDDIAQLVAQEQARREAADAERARAALEAERQLPGETPLEVGTVDTIASTAPAPAPTTAPSPEPAPAPAPPPVSGAAGIAVQTAYDQLGKPYQYAAAGPDSFDCSGLTQYAWAAAGVYLPHSSQMQYSSLPHVSIEALQPGDLVFYGSPIHHVGIYVGGGSYIHAPQTGDVVKISTIYRSDFAGAARPG